MGDRTVEGIFVTDQSRILHSRVGVPINCWRPNADKRWRYWRGV